MNAASPSRFQVFAEIAIGHEAVDDGLGVIRVGQDYGSSAGRFHAAVWVNGGFLPDGREQAEFENPRDAMRYAMRVADELVGEHLEAM